MTKRTSLNLDMSLVDEAREVLGTRGTTETVNRALAEEIELFEEVRTTHPYVLYASGVIGMLASAFGAYVVFRSPWTSLFTVGHWRIWLAVLCGVSVAAAIVIYAISEYMHRREAPRPTPAAV